MLDLITGHPKEPDLRLLSSNSGATREKHAAGIADVLGTLPAPADENEGLIREQRAEASAQFIRVRGKNAAEFPRNWRPPVQAGIRLRQYKAQADTGRRRPVANPAKRPVTGRIAPGGRRGRRTDRLGTALSSMGGGEFRPVAQAVVRTRERRPRRTRTDHGLDDSQRRPARQRRARPTSQDSPPPILERVARRSPVTAHSSPAACLPDAVSNGRAAVGPAAQPPRAALYGRSRVLAWLYDPSAWDRFRKTRGIPPPETLRPSNRNLHQSQNRPLAQTGPARAFRLCFAA